MAANMVDPVTGKPPVQPSTAPQEIPKLPPALAEPAQIKKKTAADTLKKEFIKGDGKKIREYIAKGVIIPAIKTTLWNIATKWLSMRLFENNAPAVPTDPYSQQAAQQQPNRIPYWDYYNRVNAPMNYPPNRTAYDYGEPRIPSMDEALRVQRNLVDIARSNSKLSVSIGDLYQQCRLAPQFTDWSWGWTLDEVTRAGVREDGAGWYILALPTPHQV
jgi:hypothetical protein